MSDDDTDDNWTSNITLTPQGATDDDCVMYDGPDRNISATGDIILVVGSADSEDFQPLRLRVQSAILREASSVFKAMLSPPWIESQEISAESPKEVHLPDDDPMAMEIICEGLHFMNTFTDRIMFPASNLLDAAILIDKYDLVRPMKRDTDVWLESSIQHYRYPPNDLLYALAAAWVLKAEDSFSRLSWTLMVTYQGSYAHFLSDDALQDILPSQIVGKHTSIWMVNHPDSGMTHEC